MNFIEAAIFILLFASISMPIANRFHLPFEIFLLIGSCIISIISGISRFEIPPAIVFYLFLPPILFYAAYFTAWQDFKFNLRPITLLAFGLTIFTSCVVALAAKLFLPGFTWGEGFLLGAIVSPTDASSAIAILKRTGAPRRLSAVLAGESLLNDAAALTLFRFSLVAITAGAFSLPSFVNQFVMVTVGGGFVGLLIGMLAVKILMLLDDMQAEITFTFVIAFISYLIAEHLGVSGVISTVVCGMYFGLRIPEYLPSSVRFNAKSNWNTLIFIINGFVFTLIGLELPLVIGHIEDGSKLSLLLYGFIISFVVILARVIWIYPAAYIPRFLIKRIAIKDPVPPWQALFILGWSGMRGIVSFAAALSIPLQFSKPGVFVHRDMIIFLTYCVIVATLLLPAFTLPVLLRSFNLPETIDIIKEEALARIRSLEGVIDRISEVAKKEKLPCETVNEFKKQLDRRLKTLETQLQDTPYSTLATEYFALRKLTIAAIESERETLIKMRKRGEIHDEVFHKLLDELDVEEIRAKSVRI